MLSRLFDGRLVTVVPTDAGARYVCLGRESDSDAGAHVVYLLTISPTI